MAERRPCRELVKAVTGQLLIWSFANFLFQLSPARHPGELCRQKLAKHPEVAWVYSIVSLAENAVGTYDLAGSNRSSHLAKRSVVRIRRQIAVPTPRTRTPRAISRR